MWLFIMYIDHLCPLIQVWMYGFVIKIYMWMVKFNTSGGIGVMGFISPMDSRDTYAVVDPLYGIDGLRNVDTLDDLNEIPEDRRRSGMIVGVSGGTVYYKLKDVEWIGEIIDWIEIDFTKITHVDKESPIGLIDGINNTFELLYDPIPNSEHLYLNGLLNDSGVDEDYLIDGKVIYFSIPPDIGMKIKCSYRTF